MSGTAEQPRHSSATNEIRGGRFNTVGVPTERSKDFRGTMQRLIDQLGPERPKLFVVAGFALVSTTLMVFGPKVLGHATTTLFKGIVRKFRHQGGIDFGSMHRTLLLALGLYVIGYVLSYLQGFVLAGVVQRTMQRLRMDVEAKLNAMPLSHVDGQARGDLLSRVTNDIDNVAQSLQQSVSQLLTGVLTIVGTIAMMFWISWELALVALVTVPVSLVSMKKIAGHSKGRFIAQWRHTGSLNAQVEEVFTGHTVMKAFGRQAEAEARFNDTNHQLQEAGFLAQFISGCIQPAMLFIGNLNYVAIAVFGGIKVTNGTLGIGDVQAFIQYSRQFAQPLTQTASMVNVLQSGVASAERVFELLDAPEQVADPAPTANPQPTRGHVTFDDVKIGRAHV